MKSGTSKVAFFLLPALLALSASAFAEKPTAKQYWARTEMNFQFMQKYVLDCSQDQMVGCVQALNEGAAAMTPPGIFATQKEVAAKVPYIGKQLKSFGEIGLYLLVMDTSNDSLRQKVQKQQDAIQLQVKSIRELVQRGVSIDVSAILAATKDAMLGKDPSNEPYIAGMMTNAYLRAVYDPHTHVDPNQELKDSMEQADDSFTGIGAVLTSSGGKILVGSLIEGGQALSSGIKPKDIILSVNEESVSGKDVDYVVSKVRGPEGSTLSLKIERDGQQKTFRLTRTKISTPNVKSKILTDMGTKIGYIRLRSFMDQKGCEKIFYALVDLHKQGAQALIVDLRGNGGGLLDQAVCIGSLFVGKNDIVLEGTMEGDLIDIGTGELDAVTNLPMATLIDSGSASASEILAGALQDYQRSLIIGERSFGKATVQKPQPWKISNAMVREMKTETLTISKTIARFYQPSGRTNQIVGIVPDLEVDPFPGATADDKFALREADLFTNAVSAVGKPWVQPRPKLMQDISGCMKLGANATKLYNKRQNDALSPDYRLLAAEEALTCAAVSSQYR